MTIPIRCPGFTSKLFFQLLADASVEVSCQDCRRELRRRSNTVVTHVLHVYSVSTGDLIKTEWQWPSGNRSAPIGAAS